MEAERKEALDARAGSAVSVWLKEQLWLHEAWAKHGPSCTGFWAKHPDKQRRDLEEIRDWLRGMVGQPPNPQAQPRREEAAP
jgi:hypothetical protein